MSTAERLDGAEARRPQLAAAARIDVRGWIERYALVAVTVAIFAFFALAPMTAEVFPTAANLRNVLGNQSVLVIVALASIFPLVCGEFDFSVGAVATASQVLVATVMSENGVPLPVALLLGVGLGFFIGCVNALIVTRIGVNSIIATLGIATLLSGLVTLYSDGQAIVSGIPEALTDFGSVTALGIPVIVLFVALLLVVVAYVLGHTPAGRHLLSAGANRSAATLVGLPVGRLVGGSFVVSGTLAGLAGAVMLARNGVGDPAIGNTGLTLAALSAAFLGATAFRPGQFNVGGTVVAVLFIAFSVSGLSLAGAANWVNDVFTGTALVLAVAVSTIMGRRRTGGRQ